MKTAPSLSLCTRLRFLLSPQQEQVTDVSVLMGNDPIRARIDVQEFTRHLLMIPPMVAVHQRCATTRVSSGTGGDTPIPLWASSKKLGAGRSDAREHVVAVTN